MPRSSPWPSSAATPAGEWLFHESTPRRMDRCRGGGRHRAGSAACTATPGSSGASASVRLWARGCCSGDDLAHGRRSHPAGRRPCGSSAAADVERIRARAPRRSSTGRSPRVARRLGRRIAEVSEQLARQRAAAPILEGTRVEHDSLGPRDVPLDAYYGVQTLRALENFPISGVPLGALRPPRRRARCTSRRPPRWPTPSSASSDTATDATRSSAPATTIARRRATATSSWSTWCRAAPAPPRT